MPQHKLLIVHSSNELFGADLVLLRVVDALSEAGWELLVLLPNDLAYDRQLEKALEKKNCPVLIMPLGILRRQYLKPWIFPGYAWKLWKAVGSIRRIIRQGHFTGVYSETSAVLCGALAARLEHIPHIWHLHEILEKPRLFVRTLAFMLAHLADQVIAVSQPVYDHWVAIERRLRQTMQVIHNGIDLHYYLGSGNREATRVQLGITPDDCLIGCLGRIGSWKGQEFLLQALASIPETKKAYKCILAGSTVPGQEYKLQELQDLIKTLGLQERVWVLGFQADVRPWLAAMDLLVAPSLKPDPFPTVILEAMAFSLPVIATGQGGPLEMIEEGETGFLVPAGDVTLLGQRLMMLIQNKNVRRKCGAAGRKRLEKLYPLQLFQTKIKTMFQKIIG